MYTGRDILRRLLTLNIIGIFLSVSETTCISTLIFQSFFLFGNSVYSMYY